MANSPFEMRVSQSDSNNQGFVFGVPGFRDLKIPRKTETPTHESSQEKNRRVPGR